MWKTDTPCCSECGDPLTLETWGDLCAICNRFFCRRHVLIREGVANCAACDVARRNREERGPIPPAEADRICRLLGQDLLETIGPGQESIVEEAVARIRMFTDDAADLEQRVVGAARRTTTKNRLTGACGRRRPMPS